ncbi:unnamed protein product [Rhodiola kirilowii]
MEKLLPTDEQIKFVPESYIHPPEVRPGNVEFPVFNDVPVIDFSELDHNRVELVNKIVQAGHDFGIFYLINHGMEELVQDILNLAWEFHELPIEDRAKMCSGDKTRLCRHYPSLDYEHEDVHYWRNTLVHNECHPNAGNNDLFPENPPRFREQAAAFMVEVRKVFTKVMDMICEGLGIDAGHWSDLLTERQKFTMNYYPICPDKSLVLGLPPHDDTNPLTILAEQSLYPGYQILRNGEWVSLVPPPNSLIVNFGYSWEMISNGKIKGDVHRVVVDDKHSRVTITGSIHPADNTVIEPAKELIDESKPSKYTPCLYNDLHSIRKAGCRDGKGSQFKTEA